MKLPLDEQRKIFNYYFGDFVLGKAYRSPLRDDRSPSFSTYIGSDNNLRFKDFGDENIHGGVFDLIMEMEKLTYWEAVKFYQNEIQYNRSVKNLKLKDFRVKKDIEPSVRWDNLKDFEYKYWDSFCVKRNILKKRNVFGIREWTISGYEKKPSMPGKPVFIYLFENGGYKIYNPYHDEYDLKFFSWNLPDYEGTIEGNLIITSSTKDAMVVESCSSFYSANPTSENSFRKMIPHVKDRPNTYVCFDGDSAGIKSQDKFCEEANLKSFKFIYPENTKDIAEISYIYGTKIIINQLSKILN